jgi:hypothetical protein
MVSESLDMRWIRLLPRHGPVHPLRSHPVGCRLFRSPVLLTPYRILVATLRELLAIAYATSGFTPLTWP